MNYWEKGHFNPEPRYVPNIVAFLGYHPGRSPLDGFPDQLKAARIAAGLSRRQLAVQLGVHPGTVAEWERGDVQPVAASRERIQSTLGGRPYSSTLDHQQGKGDNAIASSRKS